MSKVSIIVPYLKGPAYLRECVESVMSQGLDDYEIIIADDRDGHEVPEDVLAIPQVKHVVLDDEIDVDEFFDAKSKFFDEKKRLNLGLTVEEWEQRKAEKAAEKAALEEAERLRQQEEEDENELNGGGDDDKSDDSDDSDNDVDIVLRPYGVATARNHGVAHATGDYIYFLDGDDYLHEGCLKGLLKVAEDKKAKVVTGNRTDTWFKPISFDFEKSKPDSQIEGIVPLEGETLIEIMYKRVTVQNLLINREFYNSLDICFDEYNTYYCDMPVATKVICAAKGSAWVNGDSIYIWRHRNDPIHLPAISQKKRSKKIREFVEAYEKSLEFIGADDDDMRTAIDHELAMYAMNKFPNNLKGKNCVRYSTHLSKMPKAHIARFKKDYKAVSKMTLGLLVKGKFRMAKPLSKFASVMRKKRGLFGKPIQYWKFLDKRIFQKMPLKDNLIFIESFFGKSYSDSPKYLYEYIYNKYGDKYEYVFCLNKRAPEMPGHPKICKRHTLRYVYYTARAKYFICNTRQPAWFKKREGVVFMETWHGTPLKKLAFDLDDIHAASQNHKRIFYRHAKAWDYLVSANPFSTEVFERAFCVPREKIIEVGYPRNDILYSKDKDKIAEDVKREFNIPEGKKVVLYAPTWRDDQFYAKGKYKFTLAMDFARLQKELGDEYVILLRTHYYIADMVDLSEFDGFVFNASKYNDISRLYLASDICITDYSSVFFDYANLKRPILFFAYDYEKYEGELRGMYIDMNKELPGPILKTNDEVVDALKNIDKISSEYASRYDEFYDRFCSVDDGHASERTINIMFGEGNM